MTETTETGKQSEWHVSYPSSTAMSAYARGIEEIFRQVMGLPADLKLAQDLLSDAATITQGKSFPPSKASKI